MSGRVFPWEVRALFPARRTLSWLAIPLAAAALVGRARSADDAAAAADASVELTFGILLPLLATAAVIHLTGGSNLRDLGASAARYGMNRRARVLTALAAVTVGLVGVALLLTAVSLPAARGLSDPRLVADLLATAPVAVTLGLAYGPWLAAGACFGSRGGGVLAALLIDWLAGATALPIALATPRGHARHLLGLEAAFSFAPWLSFLALLGLAGLGALLVVLRTPR
ncbi:MAG: hypothetical protein GX607_13995 [Myxococcales bacterium]|nr:hypothetical protein [Myxococcales bacterium]